MIKTCIVIGLIAASMTVIAVGCRSSNRFGPAPHGGQAGFFSGNRSSPYQGGGGLMGSGSRSAPGFQGSGSR